jgi:TatD DNase family protein
MNLTDTHCHLNKEDLLSQADALIARAEMTGIHRFFVIGYDLESSRQAVLLSERFSQVYAVVGIHPHDAQSWNALTENRLREWTQNPRVVSIGEIGLDFYRNLSSETDQYRAFHAQMSLASEIRLPVVIHCRDAYEPLLQVLMQYPDVQGVLHCFSGTYEQAQRGLGMGYYLGIGGVITFKSAEGLREMVAQMPLDRLLLETDAPYLAPHPYRGKPNEPAFIVLIAQAVAHVRGISLENLSAITEENVGRLFKKAMAVEL